MNRLLGALALLAAASLPALAQDVVRPGQEKWTIMLGAFLPAFSTQMRVDNEQLGSGDNVDLADDLGVDQDETGGWFGVEWRFAPRHRIGFTYSRFTLGGERVINRDLQIGDEIYPAGANVSSRLRLAIIPITYSYSIVKRENDELALTAGLHWSRLTFNVEGSLSLAGFDASNEASAKANVPLPLVGVRYTHNFGPRWSAGVNAAVFSLKFGEDTWSVEGRLWSLRLHGEYRFARNWAIGAALDGFDISVDTSKENWNGGFDYGYWGPQIYVTARF
jgi:opacity protein-like surface antigen